jgi:hypothetical protein
MNEEKRYREIQRKLRVTSRKIALLQSLVFEGVAKTNREIESLTKLQKIFREV